MRKQTTGYGCGLYAVANAANLDKFITDKRLELSKGGNNIGHLSKWLQEDGLEIYIEVLYYNHLGKKLPKSATGYIPTGEGVTYLPILIHVRQHKDGKSHLVGGKIAKDGTLYLYDSLCHDIIETKLSKVNSMYAEVCGVFVFNALDGSNYAFI